MDRTIHNILQKDTFIKEDIVNLLKAEGEDRTLLFTRSSEIKQQYIGNKVWFRGLIEFSNICGKDCLYCGIRKGNRNQKRYNLSDEEILAAARFAYENKYGSIALQSGELEAEAFSGRIENLLYRIKELSHGE
ncbi:MAG TPA: [FeFe] hydrogenase H-cluster radical SAM maturase HydE, partial [Bacteroidales bacterium]|nr:[FeFe] hydrogenase H-cluster radical SAM maturase HydE [Bacteroidales bacterium]